MRQFAAVLILIALFVVLVGSRFRASDGDRLVAVARLTGTKLRNALPPGLNITAPVDALRRELVKQRASFVFETVLSDPVGDKLNFLKEAAKVGYTVVLCFIGISGPGISEQRVAMRVSQGGHDVPNEKLIARFPRTLANLQAALRGIEAGPDRSGHLATLRHAR